jgi:dTDP-4-amino-4,6-dideoxygalactose transaminase
MIDITKPFLPPFEEYQEYVQQIWERNWLTNNGPLVNELELRLKQHLDVNHLLYLNNGTVALQIAIKALDLKGEIITTPFSYIATTSSIVWEGCTPIFVDVDPDTLNIDASKIEASVTENTSAIIATHTYGNPCDIEAIDALAKKYNLKVVYDAAHCFGTLYKGKSIFDFGDISTSSFHATKIFHTVEGGAVFTKNPDLLRRMAYMRNFGHNGPKDFAEVGINGKNSELHAAMGLVNLKYIDAIQQSRKKQYDRYDFWMTSLHVKKLKVMQGIQYNYAYYPILFETEEALLKAVELLNAHWVYPRRYFYPSLNNLRYLDRQVTPVCDDLCTKVLCLPLYHTLSTEEIDLVCRLLLRAQNYSL